MFNKSRFIATYLEFMSGKELVLKSCYANFNKIKGWEMDDLKIKTLLNRSEIEYITHDRWVFSTHESVFTKDLRDFILQM
jgi:hypothetical protein